MSRLPNVVRLAGPERGLDGRSVLSKARAPLITDGRIGDFWIDTVSKKLFGPKTAAGWPDNGLIRGAAGWYPLERIVTDGARRVTEIYDWAGGEGTKPGTGYKTAAGALTATIADAADIRGAEGPEALINALAPAEGPISYDSLVASAESTGDNFKRAVSALFEPGSTMMFADVATASGGMVPSRVTSLMLQAFTAGLHGSLQWKRVSAEPSHEMKFRSQDRFLADGELDLANGGWWEPAPPIVTLAQAGAVLDGETNDDDAISRVESFAPGSSVDLLGKACRVTAYPTGAHYINGEIITDSQRVSLRRNRLDHPMDGQSWAAIGDGLNHFWLMGIAPAPNGTGFALVKRSKRHADSVSQLLAYRSEDRFQSFENADTVISDGDFDIADACMGAMQGLRIGALVRLRDNALAVYRNDFVYTDNRQDWSRVESVLTGTDELFPYGDIVDTGAAYVVAGYRGTGDLKIAYTTYASNGGSWTSYTLFAGLGYSEPALVKLQGQQKYIMFLRKDGGNLFVTTSADPTDSSGWTTPVNTGIALKNNPVYAIAEGGRLYVYLMIRDIDPTIGVENELLLIEDDPQSVYENKAFAFGALRTISDLPDRGLGYFRSAIFGRDRVWGYTAGEKDDSTSNPAPSTVFFGSTRRAPVASPYYVRQSQSRPNLLRNGTFQRWTRGTSFSTSGSTAVKVADGWAVRPSGASVTVSQVSVSPEIAAALPFGPRYGMRVEASSEDFVSVTHDFVDFGEISSLADRTITVQIFGGGAVPSGAVLSTLMHYGSGGSSDVSTARNVRILTKASSLWSAWATFQTPALAGKTVGTSPYLRISFSSSEVASMAAEYYGMKLEIGQTPSRFDAPDPAEESVRCRRFLQSLDFASGSHIEPGFCPSTTAFWAVLKYDRMSKAPSASLVGAASDLNVYPANVDGTGLTLTQPGIDRLSARLDVASGLTTGSSGILRVKSGGSAKIILDAE